MGSPSEVYIKYLILQGSSLTDAQIRYILESRGFLAPESGYLKYLRTTLVPPRPFLPKSSHVESTLFLEKHKLTTLFKPDEFSAEAFEILDKPSIKGHLEAMIVARLTLEDIASALQKRSDYYMRPEGVARYKSYFWNIDYMTFDSIKEYVLARHLVRISKDPVLKGKTRVAQEAYNKDPIRIACDSPDKRSRSINTLLALGFTAPNGTGEAILAVAKDRAMAAALNELTSQGPGYADRFLKILQGGQVIDTMLKESARADIQLRNDFDKLKLVTKPSQIITVSELCGDNYNSDYNKVSKVVAQLPAEGASYDEEDDSD